LWGLQGLRTDIWFYVSWCIGQVPVCMYLDFTQKFKKDQSFMSLNIFFPTSIISLAGL